MRTRQVFFFMQFNKPALTIGEQLELLEKRGLVIEDRSKALHYLSYISYYRLSAYAKLFQDASDKNHPFDQGTTFDDVLDLYVFDRELRLLLLDAIERIEIGVRTQIIYNYSVAEGPWWYEDCQFFKDQTILTSILYKLDEEIRRSNEVFIKHYSDKYASPASPKRPPAWMSLEVASLGLMSKLYKNLKESHPSNKAIAHKFGLSHPKVLASWLHSLTYIRNICAHHSRLWNRALTVKPLWPRHTRYKWINVEPHGLPDKRKIFMALAVVHYLLSVVTPNTHFGMKLFELIQQYPSVPIKDMGFHQGWVEDPFWRLDSQE